MIPPYIPTYESFNFDENELGDDEQEFTDALVNEHLIPAAKERLLFRDFEFLNEGLLKAEVRQIFELYKEHPKRQLQSYSSAKSLKKTHSKGNLKRQSSSPYLMM